MDLAAIADSPIGHLVPISGMDSWRGEPYQHKAFVPDPLPHTIRDVPISPSTWTAVVDAASALSQLDQAGRQVPNPELVHRPTLRREAQSTSALEGTHAAFTDVLEADLDGQRAMRSVEVGEVHNYVDAADLAFDWIADRPLNLAMLGELQQVLVRGTPGEQGDVGRIRDRQVVVGQGGPIAEARFVPPPPGELLYEGVRQWLAWINGPSDITPVVRAALAHYQFETLHPFSDGNGRLGRLIIVLQLMQYGVLHHPLLIVSPWFEARRREYQDHLLAVSQTGSLDPWIRFFADGLRAQATETLRRIEALLDYQEELRVAIRDNAIHGTRARLMEDLIGQPIVTPTWAQKRYGVSYPAANEAIAKLVRDGVLTEMTGRSYARLFGASRVLQILEG